MRKVASITRDILANLAPPSTLDFRLAPLGKMLQRVPKSVAAPSTKLQIFYNCDLLQPPLCNIDEDNATGWSEIADYHCAATAIFCRAHQRWQRQLCHRKRDRESN
eukprot:gene17860-biopygen2364